MPKPSRNTAGRRNRGLEKTVEAVRRQITAMGAEIFEVGAYKPATQRDKRQTEMLLRSWDRETLIASVPWLRFQNLHGRNIYIRPKGEHSLSLVDDLSVAAVQRMKADGFAPAVVVETSPGNFQAWLNHGRILPRELSTAVARALADRFGGDKGAADWRHFGRLVAFSNRKEKYRSDNGLYTFVKLIAATGQVYSQSESFVGGVSQKLEAAKAEADLRRRAILAFTSSPAHLKTIVDFRQAPTYAGDGNRIDLAYAVYALSHGVPEPIVRAAIASRDLSHKGNEWRQLDYVNRTVKKAYQRIESLGQAR